MPDPTYGEAGPLLAWPQAVPRSSSTPWIVPRAVLHLCCFLPTWLFWRGLTTLGTVFAGMSLLMFLEKDRD